MVEFAGPGFFGKVPGRGDFIGRRVPPALHPGWEDWLAGLTVAAREALCSSWPDDWLTAPLWHFALGASLVPPYGAAGVLVASADRVGRFFPFSVIAAAGPNAGDRTILARWSRGAEALTVGALDDGFDPDALDAALLDLGAPPAIAGANHPSGHWRLALDGEWPDDNIDALADSSPHLPGADQSAWWCRGSERVPPMHLRCSGLPGPHTMAAMVSGGFGFTDG